MTVPGGDVCSFTQQTHVWGQGVCVEHPQCRGQVIFLLGASLEFLWRGGLGFCVYPSGSPLPTAFTDIWVYRMAVFFHFRKLWNWGEGLENPSLWTPRFWVWVQLMFQGPSFAGEWWWGQGQEHVGQPSRSCSLAENTCFYGMRWCEGHCTSLCATDSKDDNVLMLSR